MAEKSTVPMIDVLTPIWQRVLKQPRICSDDNFFDLGGGPSSVAELFDEISKIYGQQLPPETIYCAPTIERLATLLEQGGALTFPPLVLLKSGSEKTPVFIAHGLGGSVMTFHQLVKHIQSPHAIYGMQARGIDGVGQPFERIEEMAELHLDAIKHRQPHGPYILVGYSLGGLVTLEIARRLLADGERISLLAMIDSYPHEDHLPLGQRVRLYALRTRHHVSSVLRMPIRDGLSYVTQRVKCRLQVTANGKGTSAVSRFDAPVPPAVQRMCDAHYLALQRYRPGPYSGKIRFVKAQIATYFPDDPVAVWARLAQEFEVDTVPGNHEEIMSTYFESLASVLSRYLREAS